jgi:transmembrane sensor
MRLDGQGWFRIKSSAAPWRIEAGGQTFTAAQGSFDLRTDPGQLRAYADSGLSLGEDNRADAGAGPPAGPARQ